MQQAQASTDIPRVGMLARVRNRRGIVASVSPYDNPHGGDAGRLHLVQVEYKDHDAPHSERLLWELEPGRELLEPNRLPRVRESSPMPAEDFDALLRAARWTALMPYVDPDGEGPLDRQPVSSPLHSGVRVEEYQLEPLLQALRMPRVNLLIADDVGLGKTVEAGLILKELLLRRRIRRVLVLVPAALRLQWRDELDDKFALPFEIVDRGRTENLRRELGIDANPWRSFSRIVASYHYLRQPDIQEQFLAASRAGEDSPRLPWDLLIVDECHNLMPSPFGADSELCQMLRRIAPCFEHRLFLSATPHNGHTRSFTGLLEILDPVRFSQTDELTDVQRRRARQLVIRRLKRELNERNASPLFCRRNQPAPLLLYRDPREAALSTAFAALRTAVRRAIAAGNAGERAGTFAIEILGKRLLSCPTAFADSWRRTRDGYARAEETADAATDADVAAAKRSVERETSDDRETEQRTGTAAGVVGAWLRNVADAVEGEMTAIDAALDDLGFVAEGPPAVEQDPSADARLDALTELIERLLLLPRAPGEAPAFRDDERLVVFTEYKTTLDYLERRLSELYDANGEAAARVLTLFGAGGQDGMDDAARERVREAFNDPDSAVRILVATDAASEGLNLHRSARYLLHYDCPWNPSRLEQRNGRLDRYGQARDVTVHHFLSDDDPDLKFLHHVIQKADEIREDLGSVNELFDTAAHKRLVEGADLARVEFELQHGLNEERKRARDQGIPGLFGGTDAQSAGAPAASGSPPDAILRQLAREIDFYPAALRQTLETAMATTGGRPQLDRVPSPGAGNTNGAGGFWRLLHPDLRGWSDTIDESLRMASPDGVAGPARRLAFDADSLLRRIGGRAVFSPRPEVALLHLAHPLIERALRTLTLRRLPGPAEAARWTVRRGGVPRGMDALILLSLEELAVNELRETFHHWVRTLILPVRNGALEDSMAHVTARNLARSEHGAQGDPEARKPESPTPAEREQAQEIFLQVEADLEAAVTRHAEDLTGSLQAQLQADGAKALRDANERYRSRQGEVSELIEQQSVKRLEREIATLRRSLAQGRLFDQRRDLERIADSIQDREREIDRRRRHYEDAREQLEGERRRIVDRLLPKRHALAGEAQAFPVTVEVRLP